MKVLLVSSSSGSTGGGEIYLHRLGVGLSQLGHGVQALCSTSTVMDKMAETLNGFAQVVRVEMVNTYQRRTRCLGAALDFAQQSRFRRIFGELRPDVVHINQQVAEDGLDLVLAAKASGVPALSTIHIAHSAASLGARFGTLRDLITSEVLRRANMIYITVAERARQDLISRFYFLGSRQVRVVPNGTFIAEPNDMARARTRARWGIAPGELVVGSVGRLEAQKEPIFALRLIAAVKQKGLNVRYVWIGDGIMRGTFQDEASQLGISDSVILDGWRDDVVRCLQALDVFIMPSKFEGMPLALLEAMGAGLCCCASDVDGITETIEDGVDGYLCPAGDLEGWRSRLEALIVDPGLRAGVGSAARNVARARFGIETMASETAKVYEYVVRSHQGEKLGATQ